MAPKALIVGLAGTSLAPGERDYLAETDPWGAILFARNVGSPAQLAALTGEIRECLSRPDAPVLVDQEGGRVQRLGPPHWRPYPAAGRIAELYALDREAGLEAAWLAGEMIARDLGAVGITVTCLPVLDIPAAGADPIIGDRAYGADAASVAALGRAAADGVLAGGCLPVIKHMPGHGRAMCDSHMRLPRVEASWPELRRTDFAPFRRLAGLPLGMTAHVVYSAIDPDQPATLSPTIISRVIREEIGFDGLLMTDDLSMGALSGPLAARARGSIAAGCDIVLHCNGNPREMAELAAVVPALSGRPLERAEAALSVLGERRSAASAPSGGRLDTLLSKVA